MLSGQKLRNEAVQGLCGGRKKAVHLIGTKLTLQAVTNSAQNNTEQTSVCGLNLDSNDAKWTC